MATKIKSKNPKILHKNFIVIISCLFFFIFSSAQETGTVFTGTWKLNESKSEMGEGPSRGASTQIVISQAGNDLSIERLSVRRSGEEAKSTEKLTLDGKECVNNSGGDREKKSTATWSADKKSLTIKSLMVFDRNGEQVTNNTKEIYSLSADGKTLTIDLTATSPRGERKNKFVYDKI